MTPNLTVVKVGGSLLADRDRLRKILASLAERDESACVVVPGGGPFADAVRAAQAVERFDDAQAHRLALDAMTRMAELFVELEPRLVLARTPAECIGRGATPVWDPSALTAGHPAIAESWAVTSDSLALWLATELRASRCVLIKSIDPPPGTSFVDLARIGIVDAAFPDFAQAFPGEIVLRGPGSVADRRAAA
ncbi:MAG TPA: uridylate kinase [Methylobacterium sp.]|jgi:aspartokinase-like uncharacterized kinase